MKKIATFAYVRDDDTLWISHFRYNGIFKIDLCTEHVEHVGSFTNHDVGDSELHYSAYKCDNLLYFFPQYCNSVDGYDISTGECFCIEIPGMKNKNGKAIIETFVYNDTMIMIPRYKDVPIMFFSLKERAIVECVELDEVKRYVSEDSKDLTLYACMRDSVIFFPIKDTNYIGSYDLKRKKEKIYIIDGVKDIKGDIEFDGTHIWLNADSGIYKWNPDVNELQFVCDCISEKEGWIEKFILYKNMMICVPRWLNNIKVIYINTLDAKNVPISTALMHNNVDIPWRDVKGCFVWKNMLVMLPIKFSETIFVDLETFVVTYKNIVLDEYIPLMNKIALKEQNNGNVFDFLSYIQQEFQGKCNDSNTIGSIIWNKITEEN